MMMMGLQREGTLQYDRSFISSVRFDRGFSTYALVLFLRDAHVESGRVSAPACDPYYWGTLLPLLFLYTVVCLYLDCEGRVCVDVGV
jgi:hypothetical protein